MRGVRGHDRYALRLAAWLALLAFCIPGGAVLATPPGERLAPDQSLGKSLEGDPVVVGDLAGQPAILTFWRTDCPPCMKELPLLEALRRTQGHRIHIIAVSIDARRSTVLRFLRRNEALQLRVTRDHRQRVARRLGVVGPPTTLVIDSDGVVRYFQAGFSEETFQKMLDILGDLVEPETPVSS